MPKTLRLHDVCLAYGESPPLFCGVSFSVGPGEGLVVSGPAGCGKSSLLEVCAGLVEPLDGAVLWDERDVAHLGPAEGTSARRTMGYMFQAHALISNMTVFDNIALPLLYHGEQEEECRLRVQDIVESCALQEVAGAFPEVLSLSQLKRAALARALASDPDLLLLDEPTAGLDAQAEVALIGVINAARARRPMAVVIASSSEVLRRSVAARHAYLDGSLRAAAA